MKSGRPGIYHNTAVVLDADGSYLGKYRKMHIPDDPHYYEKFYFTPGDLGYKVFKTRYADIGVLICWDQWFPEAARLLGLKGAEIIFIPTAIGYSSQEEGSSYAARMANCPAGPRGCQRLLSGCNQPGRIRDRTSISRG